MKKKQHHKGINYTCSKHKPMSNKLSYVALSHWMAKKLTRGHKQYQCPECGKWFFKCEL